MSSSSSPKRVVDSNPLSVSHKKPRLELDLSPPRIRTRDNALGVQIPINLFEVLDFIEEQLSLCTDGAQLLREEIDDDVKYEERVECARERYQQEFDAETFRLIGTCSGCELSDIFSNYCNASASEDFGVRLESVMFMKQLLFSNTFIPKGPNSMQTGAYHKYLSAILPHVFGEDWVYKSGQIVEYLNLPPTGKYVLLACIRRVGKTFSLCTFLAAVLYACPVTTTIAVFGNNAWVTNAVLDQTKAFVDKAKLKFGPRGTWELHSFDKSKITFSHTHGNIVVKLCIYPGNGLRGMGADIVILEEAAYANKALIPAIAPLLQLNNTVFIAVSSVESQSLFSQWLKSRDERTGKPLFDVTVISRICPDCYAKKIPAEKCGHVPPLMTSHIDESSLPVIRALIGEGRDSKFAAEVLGIETESKMFVFDTQTIQRLESSPGVKFAHSPQYVFLGFDQATGGEESRSGVVSVAFDISTENLVVSFIFTFFFISWGCLLGPMRPSLPVADFSRGTISGSGAACFAGVLQ